MLWIMMILRKCLGCHMALLSSKGNVLFNILYVFLETLWQYIAPCWIIFDACLLHSLRHLINQENLGKALSSIVTTVIFPSAQWRHFRSGCVFLQKNYLKWWLNHYPLVMCSSRIFFFLFKKLCVQKSCIVGCLA